MRQTKSMRVSWPPTDLQRFSAHFIARRSVHTARFTGDPSSYPLHKHNYQSNPEAGQEQIPQDRLSVAEDGEYGSILEDEEVHTRHLIVRPSKSSTTLQSNAAGQQIAEYEASVGAVGTVSEHPNSEPLGPLVVNEIDGAEDSPDDYLQGWRFVMVILALMLGQFMTSFDGYVITTAIPRITSDFNSLDQVGWYGSAYFVTALGTQPLFGRAFQKFPTRTIFLVAVALMVVGAIVTAAAPGSIIFISGRAITGMSVSAFYAGGTTIITYFIPLRLRPIFMSLSMAMTAVASVVGPIVSGFLTDSRLTWRFAFWMNLPIAAVVLAMGFPTFRTPNALKNSLGTKQRLRALDVPSTILVLIFAGIFVYLLQFGKIDQGALSVQTVTLILCAFTLIVSLALFSYRQHKLGDEATIPLSVVSRPIVSLCCVYVLLMQMGSLIPYYLPIYYQAAKSESAQTSGVRLVSLLAALSVAQFVSSAIFMMTNGQSSVGSMLFGAMILTTGSGLLTLLDASTPQATLTAVQILAGLGMGFGTQMPLLVSQQAFDNGPQGIAQNVPVSIELREKRARDKKLLPVSNGLILLSSFLGVSIGISVGQAIFEEELRRNLAVIPGLLDLEVIFAAGAGNIGQAVPEPLQAVVRAAYDFAVRKNFWLPTASGGVAVLVSVALGFVERRRRKGNSVSKPEDSNLARGR